MTRMRRELRALEIGLLMGCPSASWPDWSATEIWSAFGTAPMRRPTWSLPPPQTRCWLTLSTSRAHLPGSRGRSPVTTELHRVLASCDAWPGIGNATAVVKFASPLAESALESCARVVFHEKGLPPPELQVVILLGRTVRGAGSRRGPHPRSIRARSAPAQAARLTARQLRLIQLIYPGVPAC